jgi:beta-phosphoglucomutase
MPDALVFDFDGVVVDSEPLHMRAFQQVLRPVGIELTREQYYAHYIGFDDRDCFAHVLTDNGQAVKPELVLRLTGEKSQIVRELMEKEIRPLPGALELMKAAQADHCGVAICSGAQRAEIEFAGRTVGAMQYVQVIVSANDVSRGKPDPEGYRKAVAELSRKLSRPLDPKRCWAIEDAPAGIVAAKAAGCRVVAVTNSYAADGLKDADRVVASLTEVRLAELT